MILPTSLLRIRIVENGKKKLNLWLPIIVLWPFIIFTMAILSPITLIVFLAWRRSRTYIKAGPGIINALWAMRGLHVHVNDGGDQVQIDCY